MIGFTSLEILVNIIPFTLSTRIPITRNCINGFFMRRIPNLVIQSFNNCAYNLITHIKLYLIKPGVNLSNK